MRSQMLLISCAAVRVPAIATMSHSAGKQRERLRKAKAAAWHLPAFTSPAQRERSRSNAPPKACAVYPREARLQVHLAEITADLEEVRHAAATRLCFRRPERRTRLKYWNTVGHGKQISQSKGPTTHKYGPHRSI